MEEKNSQDNVIETIEAIETAIDIQSLSSETKNDILSRTKQHRGNIDEIIVPQYIDDQCMKSICGIFGTQLTFDFRKLILILICALRNL